jgi:hypothetical protein
MKKSMFLAISTVSILSAFEVEPLKDEVKKKGCTECHFVYQADFLPERSWKKMFEPQELKNHFGKEVNLSNDLKEKFLTYYSQNSCDKEDTKGRRKISKSIDPETTPLRISEVPYIESKHEDLKKEMFVENEKVKSRANCSACHKAENGEYEEDDVKVPNWEKSFFFGWQKKD